MKTCACNESLGNTGEPGCQPIFKVTKKLILVNTFDSTGAENSLTVSGGLTQNALDALINQADPTKRWYPLPLLENVTGERSATSYETAPSGRKAFVKQGTRSFSAEIWEESSVYKNQLDAIRCNDVSIFMVDVIGNLRGTIHNNENAKLYPIKIDNNSFDAVLMFGSDTVNEKLVISFDFDQTEDDSDLRLIANADMEASLINASGLIDIQSTISSITTTGFVAKLKQKFGSLANLVVDSGLVVGDFALYNVTDSANVTITSATESPKGTYTFVYSAQTSGDVLRLTPSMEGRDYKNVISNTILTP